MITSFTEKAISWMEDHLSVREVKYKKEGHTFNWKKVTSRKEEKKIPGEGKEASLHTYMTLVGSVVTLLQVLDGERPVVSAVPVCDGEALVVGVREDA